MGIMKLLVILVITVAAATTQSHARPVSDSINHIVLPHSGSADHPAAAKVDCLSWRLAVETNNLKAWKLVPQECVDYIASYMTKTQHAKDCNYVADIAFDYAKTLNLTGDGKDVWIFDIDQTAVSLLGYYARDDVKFGSIAYNDTKFEAWLAQGIAPANPAVLKLYKNVMSIGIKIVFISGTSESQRQVRIANLKNAGYYTWERLLLKAQSEKGTTAQVYKTKKRAALLGEGYRIVGNIGDQWSDIIGDNVGPRVFKLPNPMFYIP